MRQIVTPVHSADRISQTVGAVTTTYVLDTATPLTMVLSETTGGETTRYWHALDTLAQSDGTSVEYFGYDGLGSVRQLVDPTGAIQLAQTFDPYGSGYTKTGSTSSSFGYSGEQVDANGFVFLRARYYNPSMGRFFQRDTWRGNRKQPQTLNAYAYSGGNPILHTDPSGHCFTGIPGIDIPCWIAVGLLTWAYFNSCAAGSSPDPSATPTPERTRVPTMLPPNWPTNTPPATMPPTTTPTMVGTATPQPNCSQTGLRYPVDGGLFSACSYDSTLSMDVNVPSGGAGATVYAPHANAEVVIVDTTLDATTWSTGETVLNGGYGNLVVVRMRSETIGQGVLGTGPGDVYISFGHLGSVSPSIANIPLPAPVPADLILGTGVGTVGATGRQDMKPHLDIVVFVVPDSTGKTSIGEDVIFPLPKSDWFTLSMLMTNQDSLGINRTFISPAKLWPELNQTSGGGTICNVGN